MIKGVAILTMLYSHFFGMFGVRISPMVYPFFPTPHMRKQGSHSVESIGTSEPSVQAGSDVP